MFYGTFRQKMGKDVYKEVKDNFNVVSEKRGYKENFEEFINYVNTLKSKQIEVVCNNKKNKTSYTFIIDNW